MGQRLNVEIVANGEAKANVYMHWSAYTRPALAITKLAINVFEGMKEGVENDLEMFYNILMVVFPGSSINQFEYENLLKKGITNIKPQKEVNRNDGLISFTEEGMEETRHWEEGRVTIDITAKKVLFDVYYYDTEDEISKEHCGEEVESNPFEDWIPYQEFKELASKYINMINEQIWHIKIKNSDEYISFIE